MDASCSGPVCPVSSSPVPPITPSFLSSRANVSRVVSVLMLESTWAMPISVSVAAMAKAARSGKAIGAGPHETSGAADRQALGACRVIDGAAPVQVSFPEP